MKFTPRPIMVILEIKRLAKLGCAPVARMGRAKKMQRSLRKKFLPIRRRT